METQAEKIIVWIDLSLSDLNSCQLLYTAKQYRTSYWLLQQSVEKAFKAFALFDGHTEIEIRNAGHNVIRLYEKSLKKKQKTFSLFLSDVHSNPAIANHSLSQKLELNEVSAKIKRALNIYSKLGNDDLVHIPTQEIHNLLDQLYEYDPENIDFPENIFNDFAETIDEVIEWFALFNQSFANEMKDGFQKASQDEGQVKSMHKFFKKFISISLSIQFIKAVLIVCSIFTMQHTTRTRYPDDVENPLKLYTKKLPLIRQQEEIMSVFEHAVRKLKRLVNSTKQKQST